MRRRRRNISVYKDSTGSSGGRGWLTHLLHPLVEEGAKVENISRYSLVISQGGGGINLNKCDSNFFLSVVMSIFVKKKSPAKFMVEIVFIKSFSKGFLPHNKIC